MTDQPMDYRDYLIRQHEQERMRQQFERLFSKSDISIRPSTPTKIDVKWIRQSRSSQPRGPLAARSTGG
jgi:hypothetical protein